MATDLLTDVPTHRDILDAIHQHDVRLVAVEIKHENLATELAHQGRRIDLVNSKLDVVITGQTTMSVEHGKLLVRQQILFWLAVTLLPLIAGLQVWDDLRARSQESVQVEISQQGRH